MSRFVESMEAYMNMGRELGLRGTELKAFVDEQVDRERTQTNTERDERAMQRDLDRQAVALEKAERAEVVAREERERADVLAREERTAALAREERAAALEREQRAADLEREERAAARNHDLEMRRLDLEAQVRVREPPAGVAEGNAGARFRGPKLPVFDEVKDNLDSFLHRFEIFAVSQNWSRDLWANFLAALLKGKSLDVYSRLTVDAAQDYDQVKEALLKRLELTEAGFKSKFFQCRAEVGEAPKQFFGRLDNYLTRWVELASVEKTYEGLISLFIREQYYRTCSMDLVIFLRERKPETNEELAVLAEQYLDAHKGKSKSNASKAVSEPVSQTKTPGSNSLATKGESAKRSITCYLCGKQGHIARDCRSKPPLKTAAMDENPAGAMASFVCRMHSMPACKLCNVMPAGTDRHTCGAIILDELVEVDCHCNVPTLNAGQSPNLPVVTGTMGGKPVQVLRDSDCSSVVIRQSLLTPKQYTGETQVCRLIDGTLRRVPCVEVYIDTPYFCGRVKGVGMKNPLYDVILGNVPGTPMFQGRDTLPCPHRECTPCPDTAEVAAVVTRGQEAKNKVPIKPLLVVDFQEVQSRDELLAAQRTDVTLNRLWHNSTTKHRNTCSGITSWFGETWGLLFRKSKPCGDENAEIKSQLVVPTSMRTTVLNSAHSSINGEHLGVNKMLNHIASNSFWPGVG